ncbi:hypothetical protein M8J76_012106 [Diaphorina citri]|nr:hypothetical protein M8J76_012106 [Diaphorina citri]
MLEISLGCMRNTPPSPNLPGFPEWSLPEFMNCSCPQPCTFVTYSTEIEQTFADIVDEPNFYIYGEVYYRDLFAISYSRFVKFSFKELIVSFGTLASLFLGCSLISIAELIYFSLRSVTFFIHSKITEESDTDEYNDTGISTKDELVEGGKGPGKGLAEQPRYPYRMLIWVGLVSTAAVCIFLQHWGSWVAFSTGQTEIVVDNPHYPLGKIDFPAVTVCPVNKVMLSKAKVLMKE